MTPISPAPKRTSPKPATAAALWRRLTKPSDDLEPYQQQRAQLLAALLLVLLPIFIIPETVRAVINGSAPVYFASALFVLGLAYGLSRTRHYQIGAFLTLATLTIAPFSVAILPGYNADNLLPTFVWLVPVIVLGGLLLSIRGFLAVTAVNITGLLLLPHLSPTIEYTSSLILLLGLSFFVATLMTVAISIRRHDLQQIKAQTQELIQNNQFLQSIIESLDSPFYVINAQDYTIQLANSAARDMGIHTTAHMPTCYALTHHRETPCDGLEHPCPLVTVNHMKESTIVEHIHFDQDGNPHIMEVHGYPIFDDDGRVVQMIEYSLDITERKKAEETVRKLSRAVKQSGSGIVITDLEGTIEYVNPAFTQITGYTLAEALGQNPRILKSGQQPSETYREMWQTITAGQVWQGEFINKKKNGELYWEYMTISPVKEENGRLTHYIAIKEDITLRKQIETDLAQARDEALEASRLKGQLLANVSHDLRTPLGAILGYTEMLQGGVYGRLTPEQIGATNEIIGSTGDLLNFINDLIHQTQIESGKIALNPKTFALTKLLDTIESTAQATARAKGLQLTSEIAPDMSETITGDPYWLRQILANLVNNAIKFTEQGRVVIRLYQADKQHWAMSVADTGVGIPPEAQAHIFDAFRQVDDSIIREKQFGSGLGLSIVRELANLMDGQVSLTSRPGEGSVFTVLLPMAQPKANPALMEKSTL